MARVSMVFSIFLGTLVGLASPGFAGDMKHGEHMDYGAMTDLVKHSVGDLVVSSPFTRATLPNQPVGGGFLAITNNGTQDDRLLAVSAEFAMRGEIHEMAMDGDTMKMRPLPDGLVIPMGETVALAPGGYHLMFMKLAAPLVEGDVVEATLSFEFAGTVTLPFQVMGRTAKPMDHAGHDS